MIRFFSYISIFLFSASTLLGQTNLELKKKLIDGVNSFNEAELESAANSFAEGGELEGYEDIAAYNRGRALMETENKEEALGAFKNAIDKSENSVLKSHAWYNSGNLNLMNGEIETAIDNYKSALREEPSFAEARNNLSEAYKLLQQQQQQQENQDQENKDQENDEQQQDEQQQDDQQQDDQQQDDQQQDDQQQDDQQQDDQQQEGQENQESEEEEEKEDDEGKGGQEDENGEPKEVKEKQLSKEEMARILENLENEEEKIQAKLMKKKGSGKKKTIEKQW
jgi:tetratricopeptide (TPR) repeat protein